MQAIAICMITLILICCIILLLKRQFGNKNSGYVYVISNIIYGANIYKVGMTKRKNPYVRIRELNNAAVTHDFTVHILFNCADPYKVEQLLHKELKNYHYSKEFFYCNKKTILMAFKKVTNKSPKWNN